MNKLGTSTTLKEDVDITYRQMQIAAGWQMFKASPTAFTAATFATPSAYFGTTSPNAQLFVAQTVDFYKFLEAEPDSTFILATYTNACLTSIITIAFTTLF